MNAPAKRDPSMGLAGFIAEERDQFERLNAGGLSFDTEQAFAVQQLMKSDFSLDVARSNPTSVRAAMGNLAAVGLSLNPASNHAYLVPRDKAICLDISYRGLIRIATDTGIIEWVRADLVYSGDQFTYRGPAREPEIVANPFGDRGEFIGVYCIAKLRTGDVLTEVMSKADIDTIRGASKARSGPWVNYFGEMCKKAVIKRAAKTWPYSGGARERLDQAVQVDNDLNGSEGFTVDSALHEQAKHLINTGNAIEFAVFLSTLDERTEANLFNAAPEGRKTAWKNAWRKLASQGMDQLAGTASYLVSLHEGSDEIEAAEQVRDLSPEALAAVKQRLPEAVAEWVELALERHPEGE